MTVQAEDAFDFMVVYLSKIGPRSYYQGKRGGPRQVDLWMPDLLWNYWQPRVNRQEVSDATRLTHQELEPFYDAAWELCKIGVLRPGTIAPNGSFVTPSHGDSFTITEFGAQWLKKAGSRPVIDPSRLAQVLVSVGQKFGFGYEQRATEAVKTYRTANYLAACVMAGAAGESILLATAIAKTKDETSVLKDYNGTSGRRKITNLITAGLASGIVAQFTSALNVLHYWRDDAGHGVMTTISEMEAYASLTQLLRLAQFTANHWETLTKGR